MDPRIDWPDPSLPGGQTPLFVSLGASTAAGSVHHFTGQGLSRTEFLFSRYVARAVGMELADLTVGTTGFLARGTKGTSGNFMDQIYHNDAALRRARLITLVFGYGNDRAAGLPIGDYDDYYPYDEEGYHPEGLEGIRVMLDKGVTLMGCLNWCIKGCRERYPRATLIPILGAPSINKGRAVQVAENPDGERPGRAGRKLVFADPYQEGSDFARLSREFDRLMAALGMCGVNMLREGMPFIWYRAMARDPDGRYAIFSTKGPEEDPSAWVWNSHPNDDGYHEYARYVAGKVLALYR